MMPIPIPIGRVFLGWNTSPLLAAVAELVHRYRGEGKLDLGRVVVVVPGQRAGRRLREILVDTAARDSLLLTPPDVITESALPERLYVRRKPFATPLVRRLAWAAAAQGLKPSLRQSLLPHRPDANAHLHWLRIGEMLGRVQDELAADGHDVNTVISVAKTILGFADLARWEAMEAARTEYHAALHALELWDQNAARLKAIEIREVACDFDIVLIGAVDLNAVVAAMLRQVAARVTVFVVAPKEEAARFDEFGKLKPDEWQHYPVPIRDEQVLYAEDPVGQATAAAAWLAGLGEQFALEDVVIGIPDASVVPPLRRRLAEAGVRVRWMEGRTVADTGPYRLLAAAVEYADSRRYEAFAGLVRHPDVAGWLHAQGTPIKLTALDTFHGSCLPDRMAGPRLAEWDLQSVVERVGRWLTIADGHKPLRDWANVFANILKEVYSGRGELLLDHEPDRMLHASLMYLLDALDALRTVPPMLDRPFSAKDAFAVAFDNVSREVVPPPADPNALELLGWLELPLDDAAAVLVSTFNDGHIPTATGADPFLPDALRARLGVEHNARRYARDAYAATVLAQSKKRFACIVARRDAEKNPLAPSRLLFTGLDPELIERAKRWTKGGEGMPAAIASPEPEPESPFKVPKPIMGRRKSGSFNVTEFRTYLACKYRYYLKHVQELTALDDSGLELDGGAFGILLHDVLQAWANDEGWRDCGDAESLADHLTERLHLLAEKRFGQGQPAVRLQIAQAARRLMGFAHHQAGLVEAGWRIVFAESGRTSLTAEFSIGNDKTVTLRGRIDRIDYHAGKKTVRIIDYKTGDKAVSPDVAHRKQDRWIDLQLPLYRHLWRSAISTEKVPVGVGVELAYFQIPREWDGATMAFPKKWDEAMLADADEKARAVIGGILAENFWPPTDPVPDYFEDYAAICLDGLNAPSVADEEAE